MNERSSSIAKDKAAFWGFGKLLATVPGRHVQFSDRDRNCLELKMTNRIGYLINHYNMKERSLKGDGRIR